jgi:hypothetical protein
MKTTTKYQNNVFNINSYNDYFNYKNSYKKPDNVTLIKLSNNKKLGKQILVGRHKGKKLYSLTLVEREMGCTKNCFHWETCYGDNMPFAHRFKTNNTIIFTNILTDEINNLRKKHKNGIVLRLHVLGDFIDKYYARYWAGVLASYENVSIYGYTAHNEKSDIGKILLEITKKFGFDRFAVRWSNNVNSKLNTANSTDFKPRIIGAKNVKLNSITCLEQVNKVKNCASCGLCWNSKINQINFITH